MKNRFIFFISLLFIFSILFLENCKEPENIPFAEPSISVSGVDTSPFTCAPGQEFVFHVKAQANPYTHVRIESVEINITCTNGNCIDSLFYADQTESLLMERNFKFNVPANLPDAGAITMNFTVKDFKAKVASKTIVLINHLKQTDIQYFMGTLGAQLNASTGSFFSMITGLSYLIASAKNNCDKIDLVYYYLGPDNATLCAPDDTMSAWVYNHPTYGISEWGARNSTRFKYLSVFSDSSFYKISSSEIQAKYISEPSPEISIAKDLKDGSAGGNRTWLLFKTTAPAKYGILKVLKIDNLTQSSGTMSFIIKIQR